MTGGYWTVNDLANKAAQGGRPVTTSYIRRLCRQGRKNDGIDAGKLGRDWAIPQAEAQRFLSEWLDRPLSDDDGP